jgi:cation diffusion facilitator CzcD-associated flavoprotein CzcO
MNPDTRPDPEHLDVLVVGAGLSGVAAGHHLQTTAPWATYAIFEARDAIGGTWDLFRYPGVRSDSDMYTLGYSFRPWTGETAIADGGSIRRYIEETAAEGGIDRRIRFGHRIVSADWSTEEARWRVTAERTDSGAAVQLTCGFLFSCTGYYRYDRGHRPDFAGMDDYAGTLVHPQEWPEELDYEGRRIVVIGSGATAVTLVPALAEKARHVTMVQRSPSYVSAAPSGSGIARLLGRWLPRRWSGPAIRWAHALMTQAFYWFCRRWPDRARRLLRRGVEQELPDGYDVDTHFTPRYDPWDQRLCLAPDGDFFSAIRDGTASVVTDTIETFTGSGLRLTSGEELEADIIVTATGLELLFLGGIEARVDGEPVDLSSKLTYRGMMLEDVPNLALAVGYTNASWTLKCDLTCDYVARLLNEMRARDRRQATPRNTDRSVSPEPILGLTSGYVQRSAHEFPRQGPTAPWRVHQSYLRDYRALKLGPVVDDALLLSNPMPRSSRPTAGAGNGPVVTGTADRGAAGP